jgi:hypothetical protein
VSAQAEPAPYQEALRRRGRDVAGLPATDAVIDAMDPALRRAVGASWQRRAHEELRAARGFAVLSQKLLEAGAPPEPTARVARAVTDEMRHAEICRALAARYLGEDVSWPGPVPVEPSGDAEDRLVRASLHAVTLCCVSESVAAVFVEASLEAATSPSVRATLGIILADEVEHGRAGWVYLASVMGEAAVVRAVQRDMAGIVRRVAACWFDDTAITLPDGAPEHGLPSNDDTHRAVVTALRDVVVPGFAALGFDTAAASAVVAELSARAP